MAEYHKHALTLSQVQTDALSVSYGPDSLKCAIPSATGSGQGFGTSLSLPERFIPPGLQSCNFLLRVHSSYFFPRRQSLMISICALTLLDFDCSTFLRGLGSSSVVRRITPITAVEMTSTVAKRKAYFCFPGRRRDLSQPLFCWPSSVSVAACVSIADGRADGRFRLSAIEPAVALSSATSDVASIIAATGK